MDAEQVTEAYLRAEIGSQQFPVKKGRLEFYPDHVNVETANGETVANVGDWILKSPGGDIWPCTDSVFQSSYDKL